MATDKIFIAIAGNIGTGKSTLTEKLANHFGWAAHYEPVANNPYLADFYRDMKRWSFPLQIYFLNNRFLIHQKIAQGIDSAIQDRSIYEDAYIFARSLQEKGLMEERDYQCYLELYETMSQYLTAPDLVIYLRKSLPTLKDRIAMRGRDFEKEIPDEYLLDLNRYYEDWMSTYDLGKKLVIDSDHLDFKNSAEDFEYLVKNILEVLNQKDFFGNANLPYPSKFKSAATNIFGAPGAF